MSRDLERDYDIADAEGQDEDSGFFKAGDSIQVEALVRPPDALNSMNSLQKAKVASAYEYIAKAFPTEGVDYVVEFSKIGKSGVRVKVVGLNEFGRQFARHVTDSMIERKKSGGSLEDAQNG